ncbi:hypothetical protein C8N36_101145 [Pelagimonas varians]|uniref:Uncharacterized protein n=1 Tax=Pelagimonas varians TaxID=696760 RepID=A0A238JVK5_9RHOB|nr:hypothetical protein C8N36_101145 [Pelagimonas varians]SMX33852.1 hypothetical protein PEV8663_00321 [Pelagimonas varians]
MGYIPATILGLPPKRQGGIPDCMGLNRLMRLLRSWVTQVGACEHIKDLASL